MTINIESHNIGDEIILPDGSEDIEIEVPTIPLPPDINEPNDDSINGPITSTQFTTKEKEEIIKRDHFDLLDNAIKKLEGYITNVDNCGNCSQSNCCQSCQTTATICQSECTTKNCTYTCQSQCTQSCQSCQSIRNCDCDCQSH